jgi:hypothetical protein
MTNWDQKTSLFVMVPIPTKMTLICNPPDQDTDVIPIEGPSRSLASTLMGTLGMLQPELLFQVLDLMHPHE